MLRRLAGFLAALCLLASSALADGTLPLMGAGPGANAAGPSGPSVTVIAGAQTGGSGTSISITTSVAVSAGDTVVVMVGDTTGTVSSISAGGNTWTKLVSNLASTSNAEIWYCLSSNVIGSGSTITINLSGSSSFRSAAAVKISPAVSVVVGAANSASALGVTTAGSVPSGGITIGLVHSGTGGAFTQDPSFTDIFTAASAMATGYFVSAASGTVTYSPTGGGSTPSTVIGAFQ